MISNNLPRKYFMELPATVIFANYNSPTIGKYSFNGKTNKDIKITKLEPNSVYLINSFSFSVNLPESDYLSSSDPALPLKLYLNTKQSQNILKYPLSLANYQYNSDLNIYIFTSNSDDILQMSLEGQFYQLATMIGLTSLSFVTSFFIYQMDNTRYYADYRGDVQQ